MLKGSQAALCFISFQFFMYNAVQFVIQPFVNAFVQKFRGQIDLPVELRRNADDNLPCKGLIRSFARSLQKER
jgi:hypothetical protein